MNIKLYATIKPVYDGNGYDCGLWRIFAVDIIKGRRYEELIYDCLTLGTMGEVLVVGQYHDWDYESYTKDGDIDAEFVELGTLTCRNPFEDEEAAGVLLDWLEDNGKAVNLF